MRVLQVCGAFVVHTRTFNIPKIQRAHYHIRRSTTAEADPDLQSRSDAAVRDAGLWCISLTPRIFARPNYSARRTIANAVQALLLAPIYNVMMKPMRVLQVYGVFVVHARTFNIPEKNTARTLSNPTQYHRCGWPRSTEPQ